MTNFKSTSSLVLANIAVQIVSKSVYTFYVCLYYTNHYINILFELQGI